jgi:TRAP-type C4-dicarboxylate transport system permease large subunit
VSPMGWTLWRCSKTYIKLTKFYATWSFLMGWKVQTSPLGSCLFVGCAVGKLPMETAVRTIWPFYIAALVALMLITFVQAMSLTLPQLMGGLGGPGAIR